MGTGPFYDVKTNNLYYVDKAICAQVYRYDLNNNSYFCACVLGEHGLTFIFPIEGTKNEFIVGSGKRLLHIKWDGFATKVIVVRVLHELQESGITFNDAKTDSRGRLYVGTMLDGEEVDGNIFDFSKRVASLYSFTLSEGLVELKSNIGFANGIALNEKTGTMYFVDSYDPNIKQFKWDINTGKISDEKIFVDLTSYEVPKIIFPDGMAIDAEGFIYCAIFGGSKVVKVNPTTKEIQEITLPIEQVTSMAFAGKNLNSMYFTSSGLDNSLFHDAENPPMGITYPNGYLMKIEDMGVTGTEFHYFNPNI